MNDTAYTEAIDQIYAKDPRYDRMAYVFVREALDFAVKTLDKPTDGPARHVTARELLEGIRAYALEEFGPMALTVLRAWGVKRTDDFGEIVFNLVEAGKLGKTEEDSKKDFASGYDFHETFAKPFLPKVSTKRNNGRKPQSSEDKALPHERKSTGKNRRK